MTVDVLRARTEKWPVSGNTPEGVAALLARARQMFVDGYYTYENFMDAATRSIQAVEAALRIKLETSQTTPFKKLIDGARHEGLVDDYVQDILHTGREIRNNHVHATQQYLWVPAMAAAAIRTSHILVAKIFDDEPG
jgi:hypothetical protein